MDILTIKDLEELTNVNQDLFISIYLPTISKGGADIKQNSIRLKQLLRVAENKLYTMDFRKAEVDDILEPGRRLIDETRFWQNQSDGLALFIYSGEVKYYRLPIEFKESITVSNKLYLKPLLPLFSGNGQFYIMALSKNEVRLFGCTRQSVRELEFENAPRSMFDMQVDDDPNYNVPIRLANVSSGADLMYNKVTQGGAVENEYEKNELTRYFRGIDAALVAMHEGEKIPLVLAGVEYLIPIYREKSNYPYITEEFIRGNPELISGEQLHEKAWALVEPIFTKGEQVAEEKFKQFLGQKNDMTLTSLEKIIPAAFNGQIESLFIDNDIDQWGKFDHDNNKLILNEEEGTGDIDLMEYVSILTLSRGGKVYTDKVPNEGTVAAVLRY